MKTRSHALILLLLAGLTVAGGVEIKLGYYSDHLLAARKALDEMHALHDAGKFDQIFAMMTDRPASVKDQTVAGMRSSRERLGLLKVTSVVQAACRLYEVRMIVHSDFEKLAAIEMMVWQIVDGRARLQEYRVAPRGDEPLGAPTAECIDLLKRK